MDAHTHDEAQFLALLRTFWGRSTPADAEGLLRQLAAATAEGADQAELLQLVACHVATLGVAGLSH